MDKKIKKILVIVISLCILVNWPKAMLTQAASVNTENQTFCSGTYFCAYIKEDNSLWTCGGSGVIGVSYRMSEDWNWMQGSGGVSIKVMDDAKSVYTNGDRTCYAIKTDNSLWVWGENGGAFGDGTLQSSKTPVKIMDDVVCVESKKYGWMEQGIEGQRSQSYYGYAVLALKSDGTLWSWGTNHWGEVGDGTKEPRLTPVKIMDNVACATNGISLMVQKISDTIASSYAIKTDGSLWAWGSNDVGQLGNGTMNSQAAPVKITDNVQVIEAGDGTCSIIKRDGSYWCWGRQLDQTVGSIGYYKPITSPQMVADGVLSVTTSNLDKYFIKNDGSLWAWGKAPKLDLIGSGQPFEQAIPIKIMDNVREIHDGVFNTFAIQTDNILWGWGNNYDGQIGIGVATNDYQTNPIVVMDQVLAVYTTNSSTFILRTDGTLWGCGDDNYCQFGQGKHQLKRTTPVLISDHVRIYQSV